jgi:DNA polymerase III subunit epsilon
MTPLESGALGSYRDASFPPAHTPWREANFSVIDFETTGLDPAQDEIISFAAVTVSGGRIRFDDARYQLVRPKRMPGGDTIRIHGLRGVDLEEAPSLADVLGGLLEALTGRVIVAHVAAVERGFLEAALSVLGEELRNPIVDTAALDRELRRRRRQPASGIDPIGLSELARGLGLPVHRPHHADGDALTTAQAFIALATHLDAFEPQTVGSLERLEQQQGPGGAGVRSWLRRIPVWRRRRSSARP